MPAMKSKTPAERANVSGLGFFFSPKRVAIIGASRTQGKVGYVVLENFAKNGFPGKIFPVNPEAEEILGIKCYKSLREVKERVELAVICVPAKFVLKVLEDCARKSVPAVIIVTAGFAETGNKAETEKLRKFISSHKKMRVIGPNCLGVLAAKTKVDTLFLPIDRLGRPKEGGISFVSQSGALGSAILDWAAMQGFGIAKFVSYGNAMDVDESDLLEFLDNDEETKVIALYIEGVGNGRKFFEALRHTGKRKPVIVIKGGTTSEGGKAVGSHTGSLAGSNEVYETLFRQTNAIRAETMQEVFDFSRVLELEPKMKGKKIQIITNGGGYGVLCTDAAIGAGLELAKMNEKSKSAIRKACPDYAIIANPIDLTGDATSERYAIALAEAMNSREVDAIILVTLFQTPLLDESIITIVREANEKKTKPLLVLSVGGSYCQKMNSLLAKENVNVFESPVEIALALKKLRQFSGK
ncbi:MAG: CoA-binding protein [archaeon]